MLYSRVRFEEKLLAQAFEKQKQSFIQIDPRKLILGENKNEFADIALVLNREVSQTRSELILDYIELQGIQTINSTTATRTCNNKALCTWVLQKAKIPHVKSCIVFSQEEAKVVAENISYPLVLKPLFGSWGRLLAKIDNQDTLEAILEHKEALNNPYHSIFYLQEYIEKPDRDIRVLVVDKEPIAAMYRQSDHWITNTALGGNPKKCDLDNDLVKIVKSAVDTLRVEIAGVDIIETVSGYQVLEVNSTAEFHGLQSVTEVNIADCIANYVIKKSKKI